MAIFILAPMDDVTNTAFRRVVADCAAPDLFMSEFVNVDGLCSKGRERLLHKLSLLHDNSPVIAQIWGKTPENFEKIADELASSGKYAGIDINMGCPEKSIVNNGCCAGFIRNPELAVEVIKAVKRGAAGRCPVSVKTRLGFNEVDFSWHKLILKQDIDMLTVHMRTRAEMSKVPAHWELMPNIIKLRDKISPKTKIIGNGDVLNRDMGEKLAKTYGCDGIMIGRGVFSDPYIFSTQSPWETLSRESKIALYEKHIQLFESADPSNLKRFDSLKKFAKVYVSGFADAKELREELYAQTTFEGLFSTLAAAKQ
jgi:tRNA-dihydrouridine synthase